MNWTANIPDKLDSNTYANAFSHIETSDAFRKKLIAQLQQSQEEQGMPVKSVEQPLIRSWQRKKVFTSACLATVLLLIILAVGIPRMLPATVPADSSFTSASSATPSSTGSQTTGQSTATRPTSLDDQAYSQLLLATADPIKLPAALLGPDLTSRMSPGNYVVSMQDRADLVVKATISNVQMKEYPIKFLVKPEDYKAFMTAEENKYRFRTYYTVVYEARIDQVLFDSEFGQPIAGEPLIIEQILYPMDSYDDYLLPRVGRQYILPLIRRESLDLISSDEHAQYDAVYNDHMLESRIALLFDQTPQIECTQDGNIIFFADPTFTTSLKGEKPGIGWIELLDNQSSKIVMPDETSPLYRDSMWIRSGLAFEKELVSFSKK